MGVILSTANDLSATSGAGYTFSTLHTGPGSTSLATSTDSLRTRQLADACRLLHTYPGATAVGQSVIRIQRGAATFSVANKVVAVLGIDAGAGWSEIRVRLIGRSLAGAQLWSTTQTNVWTMSTAAANLAASATSLASSSHIVLPVGLADVGMLDIQLEPPLLDLDPAASNYIDVGGLWLGSYWESDFAIAEGWTERLDEAGVTGYSRGRQAYGDAEVVYRTLDFGLVRMSSASKDALKARLYQLGKTSPLLFATRLPGSATIQTDPGWMYGSVIEAPAIRRQAGSYFRCDLRIAEEA